MLGLTNKTSKATKTSKKAWNFTEILFTLVAQW